jgi:hypothetical protein
MSLQREEQRRKEMERLDRERRKEEEDCCVRGREKKRGSNESKGISMSTWRNFC